MSAQKTEATKAQELGKLKAWVKKLIPDDFDKLDVDSKYDPAISFEENKTILREELRLFLKSSPEEIEEQAKEQLARQAALDEQKRKDAEAEADAFNKKQAEEYKKTENLNIEKYYDRAIRGVKKLCQGYSNLLFVKGRGGIGKSRQIRQALTTEAAEFVEVTGEVTEAYLYRLIFENNGKVIWFKDVVKLLHGIGSINMLKNATETEENRILTKNNYSKDQGDLPERFVCRCKFIFDFNNLSGISLKEDFEALQTRGDFIELALCDEDIKAIMLAIASTKEEKEVTNFLIELKEKQPLLKLNLRTQWKANKTFEYAQKNNLDWRKEIESEAANSSKSRLLLYSLIGNRVIGTKELKQILIRENVAPTLRTADRLVNEWLFLDELYVWSENERNFLVGINERKTLTN